MAGPTAVRVVAARGGSAPYPHSRSCSAHARAARIGSGSTRAAVGPAGRARDAGHARRRRARREVVDIAMGMNDRIPDANVSVFGGAGHAVHLEQPFAIVHVLT